ncbi:unnamed protein product, partial [Closterium sp. Yama58-4]
PCSTIASMVRFLTPLETLQIFVPYGGFVPPSTSRFSSFAGCWGTRESRRGRTLSRNIA